MRFPRSIKNGLRRLATAGTLVVVVLSSPIASKAEEKDAAKIVFVAGPRSHGYGSHEHKAGCLLLAKALNDNMPGIHAEVHTEGWPKDPESAFKDAAAIVMYGDGGSRHMVNRHLEAVDAMAKKGVGIACFHYAVEVPKGESGDRFLDWLGGYFEAHWSVNPYWTAEFKTLPEHPTTRGVKPFSIHDEWYYHMRFRKDLEGVTPILSALPPKSSLGRRDGIRSGNPHVRAAVLERGEAQHVAWVTENEGSGRGFGFTGGHVHWNWGNDHFRKLALNSIVWVAGLEVPQGGVPSKTPTLDELLANQDYTPPKKFDVKVIRAKLDAWSAEASE